MILRLIRRWVNLLNSKHGNQNKRRDAGSREKIDFMPDLLIHARRPRDRPMYLLWWWSFLKKAPILIHLEIMLLQVRDHDECFRLHKRRCGTAMMMMMLPLSRWRSGFCWFPSWSAAWSAADSSLREDLSLPPSTVADCARREMLLNLNGEGWRNGRRTGPSSRGWCSGWWTSGCWRDSSSPMKGRKMRIGGQTKIVAK